MRDMGDGPGERVYPKSKKKPKVRGPLPAGFYDRYIRVKSDGATIDEAQRARDLERLAQIKKRRK